MPVLIACESSGRVRDEFLANGHSAISCDLLPTETPGPHYEGDIMDMIYGRAGEIICHRRWSMMIAFPPCDDIAVSGARWFPEKRETGEQRKSIEFFLQLFESGIPKIAIENPIGIMSGKKKYLKKYYPDLYERAKNLPKPQIIQPWMFGHGETKATCLWLKGLPKLVPTDIVEGREARVHRMPPSEHRAKDRARTYPGIGAAMASQWSV